MNIFVIITILLGLSFNVYSEDRIPVKFLPKGLEAPWDGFLFTVDAEMKARQNTLDRDHFKQLFEMEKEVVNKQDKLINLQSDRIDTVSNINTNLNDQLQQEKSALNKALYVGAGILLYHVIRVNVR